MAAGFPGLQRWAGEVAAVTIHELPSGYLTVRHGIDGPFIDGLPINSMVIFHGYVSHNQMVLYNA